MQMGFMNSSNKISSSCVVPVEFTHSYASGQTGCGKTTGFVYPNLEERIKNNHGILLYDYKGKEHLAVKYLANKYNRLDDVIEIGKDWGSCINIVKYMNKAQLFEFFKQMNGRTDGDMYWTNSSANICSEVLTILKNTNKVINICKKYSNIPIEEKHIKILTKLFIGFEMNFENTLSNLANIVCTKKNILSFLEKMDNLKYIVDKIISEHIITDASKAKENLDNYVDIFNELINLEDKIILAKKALSTFSNETKTADNDYTTLDSLISTINTPLSAITTIKYLNHDELDIVEALNNGKIVVINTNSFSDQIISALNSSLFFELTKRSSKVSTPISIFIDEAQKVVSEDFNLPVDVLRECKVELFLSFQNEELMIEKLGLNKFTSLVKNLKRRYIFKNPNMYKNIEELSRLDTYEYYDDMLMDFKIYEVTNPLQLNQKDFFKVELKYQNLKKIKEKYSYKSENKNHILIYDDSLMEDGMLILRDKNNKDSVVNVYKNENFNKAVKRFIDSLNGKSYLDETIPTFEECVKNFGLKNKN